MATEVWRSMGADTRRLQRLVPSVWPQCVSRHSSEHSSHSQTACRLGCTVFAAQPADRETKAEVTGVPEEVHQRARCCPDMSLLPLPAVQRRTYTQTRPLHLPPCLSTASRRPGYSSGSNG